LSQAALEAVVSSLLPLFRPCVPVIEQELPENAEQSPFDFPQRAHVLDELWKNALCGVFKCSGAGAPGTWKQILPSPVTADPGSGAIPVGYLILNVTQGTLKRHAGLYDWQTVIGLTGGKVGFYGVTPVVQPSGANQAAVTLGNTDGEIAGLTISDPATQAEVQALRDKCEELADDVQALSALVHALREALVATGLVRGGA
jgi:hypothetical protein